MRLARHIIAVTLLVLYVAQIVGGQAIHLCQHSSEGGDCCGETHCDVSEKPSRPHRHSHVHDHGHCHHEHGEHAHAEDEQQQEEGVPVQDNNQEHDPSACWVCQVLAQAQDRPIQLKVTESSAVSAANIVAIPDFYPSPSRSGFHSRAPPAVHA